MFFGFSKNSCSKALKSAEKVAGRWIFSGFQRIRTRTLTRGRKLEGDPGGFFENYGSQAPKIGRGGSGVQVGKWVRVLRKFDDRTWSGQEVALLLLGAGRGNDGRQRIVENAPQRRLLGQRVLVDVDYNQRAFGQIKVGGNSPVTTRRDRICEFVIETKFRDKKW